MEIRQMEHSRRAVLFALAAAPLAFAADPDSPAARGRAFLASLLDADLRLLPEFAGSKTYWLYHDNYLAAHVLRASHPEIVAAIRKSIASYDVHGSGKIEIVTGEARNPLPFRHYELTVVANRGDKVIRTEIVTDKPMKGWEKYADLLLLAAIAEAEKPKIAGENLDAALKMWDGKGFWDAASTDVRPYATYKLALALIAAEKLKREIKPRAEIERRLLAVQAKSGGWITDYTADGRPHGLANVETSSLAILALAHLLG